jgi:hypothetical protein
MRLERAGRAAVLLASALVSGCTGMFGMMQEPPPPVPPVDPAVVAAQALTSHLELVQRLVEGTPAQQAAILASVKHRYNLTPMMAADELDYALVLAAPGHMGSDPAHAQALLSNVLASRDALMPPERALAVMVLRDVNRRLDLVASAQRMQAQLAEDGRLQQEQAARRLDTEVEENHRLRRDLERARAKLKAIANIERSLNQRKSAPAGPTP